MDDEAMKAMARRIAAASYVGNDPWQDGLRTDILAGNCDDGPVVSAALAAIIETRDRDAELVAAFIEREGMTTNHAGIPVMAEVNQRLAAAIRSGQQFRKDV